MSMHVYSLIVEDELGDQLSNLLLAELLDSTAQAEQLVADLVGSSAGRCTPKRRIMLRSMSELMTEACTRNPSAVPAPRKMIHI